MFQIAVREHVRFGRGDGRRIEFSVRRNLFERVRGVVAPAEFAVRHNFETAGMIINSAILVNAGEHTAHSAHGFVVFLIRRNAHRNTLVRFG